MIKDGVEYLDPYGVVAKKEFALNLWLLAQPLDLEALQREGYLVKVGAWWKMTKKLPDHVMKKVNAVMNSPKHGGLVKFSKSVKGSQKLAEKMGVDWRGPRPE